ncbi:hypothetical protein, partial [Sphingomonas sp. 66-10]|uniref:hypothetical protein n=1 Tax=Sphingomonas sp. 66-10 TaxID=1895848 RepID=UPI00257CD5BE
MPEITAAIICPLAFGWFMGKGGPIAVHAPPKSQNSTIAHLPHQRARWSRKALLPQAADRVLALEGKWQAQ